MAVPLAALLLLLLPLAVLLLPPAPVLGTGCVPGAGQAAHALSAAADGNLARYVPAGHPVAVCALHDPAPSTLPAVPWNVPLAQGAHRPSPRSEGSTARYSPTPHAVVVCGTHCGSASGAVPVPAADRRRNWPASHHAHTCATVVDPSLSSNWSGPHVSSGCGLHADADAVVARAVSDVRYVPAGQGAHRARDVTLALPAACSPARHARAGCGVQAARVWLPSATKEPAAHARHSCRATRLKWRAIRSPGPHSAGCCSRQKDAALTPALNVPGAHAAHTPSVVLVGTVARRSPGPHATTAWGVQLASALALNWPAGHSPHTPTKIKTRTRARPC